MYVMYHATRKPARVRSVYSESPFARARQTKGKIAVTIETYIMLVSAILEGNAVAMCHLYCRPALDLQVVPSRVVVPRDGILVMFGLNYPPRTFSCLDLGFGHVIRALKHIAFSMSKIEFEK